VSGAVSTKELLSEIRVSARRAATGHVTLVFATYNLPLCTRCENPLWDAAGSTIYDRPSQVLDPAAEVLNRSAAARREAEGDTGFAMPTRLRLEDWVAYQEKVQKEKTEPIRPVGWIIVVETGFIKYHQITVETDKAGNAQLGIKKTLSRSADFQEMGCHLYLKGLGRLQVEAKEVQEMLRAMSRATEI
jgi:hypothetical protein